MARPTEQAEGRFKEHGSILKIMDRLNLGRAKERPLYFGRWLLVFFYCFHSCEARKPDSKWATGAWGLREQDKDCTFSEQQGIKSHVGWGLCQPGAGVGADAGAGLYFSNNSLGRGLVEEALRKRI